MENKRNVFFAITSIILMIGGGLLLCQTLNVYYHSLAPFAVIALSFLSVFLYVAGAALMGMCVTRNNYRYMDDMNGGIVFALLLVATGLLLLGFNTRFLPVVLKSFFFSLPMILFVIGSICLCKRHLIWGIILIALGKYFLLSKIEKVFPDALVIDQFLSVYWPVVIILFGIIIMLSIITNSKNFCVHTKVKWKKDNIPNENENHDGKINYKFTFSGTEQVILDPVFRGGNIDITFGGMDLDLRRTTLAEGDTYLYINVVFGGLEITVPDHWDVELRQNRFAGGIEDSRKNHNTEKDLTRKLIIVAKCSFGGIDIK